MPATRHDAHAITSFRHSIVASIPACHAGDRGSIPRVGGKLLGTCYCILTPHRIESNYIHLREHTIHVLGTIYLLTSLLVIGRTLIGDQFLKDT